MSWNSALKSELLCAGCGFKTCCILDLLGEKGLFRASGLLNWLSYDKSNPIFHQGTPAIGWYILCRGLAKLIFRTPQGKRVLLKFCRPEDILGGVGCGVHGVSAVAMGEVVACLIVRDVAIALVRQHPELALEVSRRLAEERHMLVERLAFIAYGSVREQLAKGLLELGKHYGVRSGDDLLVDLPLTQGDLADMIGTSRQTVCQELQKLANRGLIQEEGRRIILTDPEALRRLG